MGSDSQNSGRTIKSGCCELAISHRLLAYGFLTFSLWPLAFLEPPCIVGGGVTTRGSGQKTA
ncbi:hypothetical protein B0537_08340 [Desulforamulus ferrireducens]|uniref:Uncharacterized protein n=1 Tax=Desulforamulus ferrireducens TaxID=1833852 RepID=A0A1S6IWE0_9FIRM|nr:hypothetical protein B0537_08340 [Desulforamulus ferrireducens]